VYNHVLLGLPIAPLPDSDKPPKAPVPSSSTTVRA